MSSVNPEDINAFAGMLGKLNQIQEGRKVVDTAAAKADRMAKNDMTAILSSFAAASGTPSALTLNETVKPLPAEFKPKTISPVLGEPEKEHPTHDYYVGEDGEPGSEESWDGVSPDTEMFGDMGKVDDPQEEEDQESFGKPVKPVATEDSLTSIKKRLGDYLQDIKNGVKVDDKELSDKSTQDDKLGPAVKTIKTDDDKIIKIHGNEDDGFRLKINNKLHSKSFENIDDAVMACEMYVAKRRQQQTQENQDYVEER